MTIGTARCGSSLSSTFPNIHVSKDGGVFPFSLRWIYPCLTQMNSRSGPDFLSGVIMCRDKSFKTHLSSTVYRVTLRSGC